MRPSRVTQREMNGTRHCRPARSPARRRLWLGAALLCGRSCAGGRRAAKRASHDGRSSFKTWWFGVIRFTAHEEFRRLRYRESLLGKLLAQLTGDAHDPQPSPSRKLEMDERTAELRRCLQQLPTRQAEVLHLVFYQDLTINEAAQIMDVGIGSARQHYERGKARLRTLLQPDSHHE